MLIVHNMLGVGQLWIISFYVSDMLLELGLQVAASLTHIREVACFTCQRVDPTFVVGQSVAVWGRFGELCYCVAAFVTDFAACVSE
jgi:hypothetical protein